MPTETEETSRRPRPEHEWHIRIRQRNEVIREALDTWLGDGNSRRLKKAAALIETPPFAPPPSPRLQHETERLFATVLRAMFAPPAPRGNLRDQRAHRAAEIAKSV